MRKKFLLTLLLVAVLGLVWTNTVGNSFSEVIAGEAEPSSVGIYERSFTFDVYHYHHRSIHTLGVSVPPSLYDYYESRSHFVGSGNDYARFATPSVFQTVAENIQNVTGQVPYSDEQFANAVLTIVRQITYIRSSAKYPVEALVENSGDCDVLSLLAASIMQAGGLDVVLLHYKGLKPNHMNIGVFLPYKHVYRTWWTAPTGFEFNNKTYWMAEATPLGTWKVGDRPELVAYAEPNIIPLEKAEKASPARVFSYLDKPLAASAISVTVALDNSSLNEEERSLTITGEISPPLPNENVVMYVVQGWSAPTVYKTVSDQFGKYSFKWNTTQTGTYNITTSWSGTSNYAGSDSETLTVFVGAYESMFDENV